MKTTSRKNDEEMRPEYDLKAMGPMVRGKYFALAAAGSHVIRLEPDVAAAFPTEQSVNDALRGLIALAKGSVGAKPARTAKRARKAA